MLQSVQRRGGACVCVSGLWMSQDYIQVVTFRADSALDPCFFSPGLARSDPTKVSILTHSQGHQYSSRCR